MLEVAPLALLARSSAGSSDAASCAMPRALTFRVAYVPPAAQLASMDADDLARLAALFEGSGERTLLVVWARSSAWRAENRFCDDAHPHRDSSYMYL